MYLDIQLQDLSFPIELGKEVSCSIRLSNKTQKHVAFKVTARIRGKYTASIPEKYTVPPNLELVLPGSSCDLKVTMIGPKEAPPSMQYNYKFSIKSVIANPSATTEDVIKKLFESCLVQKHELGVIYTSPPQIPSPVALYSASTRKLLVQASELRFHFERKKVLSYSFQLSNMTDNHVGFMVKTDEKYHVRPKIGTLLPRSPCDINVKMRAPKEFPRNGQCKDEFWIQCIVASHAAILGDITAEMFNEAEHIGQDLGQDLKLGVVYTLSHHSQSYTSSPDLSTMPERTLNKNKVIEKLDRNQGHDDVFVKGIVTGLLGVIIWFLVTKILRLIWSLAFLILIFVVKMIRNIVSDKVEDLILKSVAFILMNFFPVIFRHCKHFLSILFERMWRTNTA